MAESIISKKIDAPFIPSELSEIGKSVSKAEINYVKSIIGRQWRCVENRWSKSTGQVVVVKNNLISHMTPLLSGKVDDLETIDKVQDINILKVIVYIKHILDQVKSHDFNYARLKEHLERLIEYFLKQTELDISEIYLKLDIKLVKKEEDTDNKQFSKIASKFRNTIKKVASNKEMVKELFKKLSKTFNTINKRLKTIRNH